MRIVNSNNTQQAVSGKMKKVLLVLGLFLATPFSVQAVTVYQQFNDNSGVLNIDDEYVVIGSFIPSQNITTVPAELQIIFENKTGICSNTLFAVFVATSSDNGVLAESQKYVDFRPVLSPSGGCVPDDNNVYFTVGTTTSASSFAIRQTYLASTTYYIWVANFAGGDGIDVYTNLSEDFYYGYLTAGGFSLSLPILPGLSGYTDVGISTTSQQVYCNSNFGTTTGLLDSLGQSIALGACNVSVFLFIPSQTAVNNFFNIEDSLSVRFPFAWYYDIKNVFLGLTASTSANYPTYAYDLSAAASTTPLAQNIIGSSLSLASPTSIQSFAGDSVWTTLRTLMSYMLWIAFAYFVYRKIQGIWHVNVT